MELFKYNPNPSSPLSLSSIHFTNDPSLVPHMPFLISSSWFTSPAKTSINGRIFFLPILPFRKLSIPHACVSLYMRNDTLFSLVLIAYLPMFMSTLNFRICVPLKRECGNEKLRGKKESWGRKRNDVRIDKGRKLVN